MIALIGKGGALRMLDRHDEALAAHEEALQEARGAGDRRGVANALIGKGGVLQMLGRSDEALAVYEEALQEARAAGDRWTVANALNGKGGALRMLGRHDEALAAHEEALQEARAAGNRWGVANALYCRGDALRMLGRPDEALAAHEEALQEARAAGDRWTVANALNGKGDALWMLDRDDEALAAHEEALQEARAAGNRWGVANALYCRGDALRMLGRPDEALAAHEEALQEARAAGDRWTVANALNGKGDALRTLDRHDESLAAHEEALQEARAAGNRSGVANALYGKGDALRMLDRHDEALAAYEAALQEARAAGNQMTEANATVAVAEILEGTGADRVRSLGLFEQAERVGRRLGYGYAIQRGQAGRRRLAEARTGKEGDTTRPPTGAHGGAEGGDATGSTGSPSLSRPAPGILETRVRTVYGPKALEGLPESVEARRNVLSSMLPEGRVWTVALMCDIRGYTTAMAQTDPERQLAILNRYLSRGTEIVQGQGGGVDKYMGDAILAFFLATDVLDPDPVDMAATTRAAMNAALDLVHDPDMRKAFKPFQNSYTNLEDEHFGIGVGLASGWASFGEIGAPYRREYTMIGRAVNLVARVQTAARAWEVVATRECWEDGAAGGATTGFAAEWPGDRELPQLKGYETTRLVLVSRETGHA